MNRRQAARNLKAPFSVSQCIELATALNKAGDIYIPKADEIDVSILDGRSMRAFKVEEAYAKGKKLGVLVAAEFIADTLGRNNPKFDRRQFLTLVRGSKVSHAS